MDYAFLKCNNRYVNGINKFFNPLSKSVFLNTDFLLFLVYKYNRNKANTPPWGEFNSIDREIKNVKLFWLSNF